MKLQTDQGLRCQFDQGFCMIYGIHFHILRSFWNLSKRHSETNKHFGRCSFVVNLRKRARRLKTWQNFVYSCFICPPLPIYETLLGALKLIEPRPEKIRCNFVVCEQQRRRSACASAQAHQRLCYMLSSKSDHSTSYIQTFQEFS